jgi:hypothetical protein
MNIKIWTIPESDFGLWCQHCGGYGTWTEYRDRLVAVIADQEQQSNRVETVEIGVMEMLDELDRRGWPNTPDNRAAVAALRKEKQSG